MFVVGAAVFASQAQSRAQTGSSSIGLNDTRTSLEKIQSIERIQNDIGTLAKTGMERGGLSSAMQPFADAGGMAGKLFDAVKDKAADAAGTLKDPELAGLQQAIKNGDGTIEQERLDKLICSNFPLNPSCSPPP